MVAETFTYGDYTMQKLFLFFLILSFVIISCDSSNPVAVTDGEGNIFNDSSATTDDNNDSSLPTQDKDQKNDDTVLPTQDETTQPDNSTTPDDTTVPDGQIIPDELPDMDSVDPDDMTLPDENGGNDSTTAIDEDSEQITDSDPDEIVVPDETTEEVPDVDTVVVIDPAGDEDGDGILNGVEGTVDTDGDGTPNYLDTDSDADGILDSEEGIDDPDGDGNPNYIDTDSDGDWIDDIVESIQDPDGDGTPNFLDSDSDGDGIADELEGDVDFDEDGTPNFLDSDSDGDAVPDSVEGVNDTDGDGYANFVDLDSDNDGLNDSLENSIGSDLNSNDTDSDGFDDNTEYAYGEQIDPSHTGAEYVTDDSLGIPSDVFYVILPYTDPEKIKPLEFTTDIRSADILIQIDLSGSMDGEINNLKSGIQNTIINNIRASVPDAAFGLATFSDWEGGSYGEPYELVQAITTNATTIQSAVNSIGVEDGGWEAHAEALYQGAAGTGYTPRIQQWQCIDGDSCGCNEYGWVTVDAGIAPIPAQPSGWRADSLPIIMMITDESFTTLIQYLEAEYDSDFQYQPGYPAAHSISDAVTAMNVINAKFMGIYSDSAVVSNYQSVATGTGSTSISTGNPFLYSISSDGSGLSTSVANGVIELLENLSMDVTTNKESISNPLSIDTTQFIKTVSPNYASPSSGATGQDSVSFFGVKPGTLVYFDVSFENTIYEPTSSVSTLFRAKINVRGQGTTLSTREVLIIVPGIIEGGCGSEGC